MEVQWTPTSLTQHSMWDPPGGCRPVVLSSVWLVTVSDLGPFTWSPVGRQVGCFQFEHFQ
jgi:hypothetical protein